MGNVEARTSENYHNNLINEDGSKNMDAYDDSYVRSIMEQVLLEHMGWDLRDCDNKYGIDKVFFPHAKFGVELEHGGFDTDDFFNHEGYSRKTDLPYPTLNMPERKLKFWLKDKLWYKEDWNDPKSQWLFTLNVSEKEKNIFCRTNVNCDHFLIVRPEKILNGDYVIKEIYCNNSKKFEKFLCFKQEDVEVYNIINGKLIKS
jgi:hypothetical protein